MMELEFLDVFHRLVVERQLVHLFPHGIGSIRIDRDDLDALGDQFFHLTGKTPAQIAERLVLTGVARALAYRVVADDQRHVVALLETDLCFLKHQ